MKRVMIIGCGGSGKSTLARKLHALTGLPLFHLDQYFWKPNWVELDKAEWETKIRQLAAQEVWIMDGNYGGTMDIRLQRADTIIFMDRSRWLNLSRLLKRLIQNFGKARPDMTKDCNERLNWEFLTYVYHYNTTRRPGILKKLEHYGKKATVVRLTSNAAVREFLDQIALSSNQRTS